LSVLIELKNVTKRFGGLKAVNDFSGTIEEGAIVGLIGPNGAGKTTLFNMIAGTFPPTSGSIIYNGTDITKLRTFEICKIGIARTFQVTKPFEGMSIIENIMVAAFYNTSNRKVAYEKAMMVYNLLDMAGKPEQQAGDLTTVDRKKLEVARALALNPKVLLLDEVMAGCNPQEKFEMVNVVHQIQKKGVTIIIIEHDIKTIMTISDKVIMLDRGEKLIEGLPKEVSNDKRAIAAYLGEEFTDAEG